ncbi:MAG: NFACT family protein [Lachnospiraceae bacterium]|nr:NFACT family protein [Lachnospiraceae bacterium]
MALDGITIASLLPELKNALEKGRLSKISQTQANELLLTIKGNQKDPYRLLINVSPGMPYICFTDENKPAPLTAPGFCMMLRKYIANGRILDITQPGMERILIFSIEHLNELGDLCKKELIIELMGKYSNIIFCDENRRVLDAIRHVPPSVSSLRTILPGASYYLPDELKKQDPLPVAEAITNGAAECIPEEFFSSADTLVSRMYMFFAGLSPIYCQHILNLSGIESDRSAASLNEEERLHFSRVFAREMQSVIQGEFSPAIYYNGDKPMDFSPIVLSVYPEYTMQTVPSVSEMIFRFYYEKSQHSFIQGKSADLRKIIHNALERNRKKFALLEKQMKDAQKADKFRLQGELLTAYAYQYPEPVKTVTVENYYDDNKPLTITLDETKTVRQNAASFYERYNKLKRTQEATEGLLAETQEAISHLESMQLSLSLSKTEADLTDIANELKKAGYMKKTVQTGSKKKPVKEPAVAGKPLHFVNCDGMDMFVGKNNLQNEYVTFTLAGPNDMWFHAKNVPGSHVIVKTGGKEMSDRAYEEAAALAAYFCQNRDSDKVEIDYVARKAIKKPPKSAFGFVIYHTNYSMIARPDISGLTEIKDGSSK